MPELTVEERLKALEAQVETIAGAVSRMTADRIEEMAEGWPGFLRHRKMRNRTAEPVQSPTEETP